MKIPKQNYIRNLKMNEHAETLIDFIKILYIQFITLSCKYIKFIKIKIIFFSKIFYNDQFRELLYILYYVRQYKSYQEITLNLLF